MKKIFWVFRTDLRQLESYHSIKNLEEFKKTSWDFYLNQGIYFLENNVFDEVIIWRLQPKEKQYDITFDINGKKFIQKWVNDFKEVFKYSKPDVTFFRGGFKDYDILTKQNPNFFGLKLYLGAGKRVNPQYGGVYDKILIEDNKHLTSNKHIPFYKTANQEIFKPLNLEKKYDLVWICNFSQIRYKGQEFFIDKISKSSYLKSLRIAHCGNEENVGKLICQKYEVRNIEFLGHLKREQINEVLNQSKFGIITSNEEDGCPRIITEVLMSGTPLLLRDKTKLLNFYKEKSLIEFNDNNIEEKIKESMNKDYQIESLENINKISIDKICKLNLDLWRQL
jgi:hypothetical protein